MSASYKSLIVIGYSPEMLDYTNCSEEEWERFSDDWGFYVDCTGCHVEYVFGQKMWETDTMIKMPLWAMPQIDTNKFYLDLSREFAQYNVKIKRECAMPNLFLICQCS